MGDMLPPPTAPASLPDPESEGARLLQRFCERCHVLPDPRQHSAAEWPGVVEKMKGHMEAMGKPLPDNKTLRDIVGFLQRHGRDGK